MNKQDNQFEILVGMILGVFGIVSAIMASILTLFIAELTQDPIAVKVMAIIVLVLIFGGYAVIGGAGAKYMMYLKGENHESG